LNVDDIVIAFGAVSVDSPYKGWAYLQESLEMLKNSQNIKNILVLIFGSGYNKLIAEAIPFRTKFLGYLKDEYSMALVYNASDILIVPSLAEVFGYVVLESLSCGTPVVAFDVGGIPDLIIHKKNGYLAKYRNAEDIAAGIDYVISNKVKGYVLPEMGKDEILNKHKSLINSILFKHQ
jgi:glycosyltransferase involved in cell wall biosynthesis